MIVQVQGSLKWYSVRSALQIRQKYVHAQLFFFSLSHILEESVESDSKVIVFIIYRNY